MIYLDNAATTLRKPPCVIDAVVNAMQTMGNSGRSAHAESLTASRTIYAAREALAALFGCERADHVCFTANSTEALNIAISGLLAPGDHVLSTDLEHNSVLRPLYREKERGVSVSFLPANRQGCIDYAGFDRLDRCTDVSAIAAAAVPDKARSRNAQRSRHRGSACRRGIHPGDGHGRNPHARTRAGPPVL